MMKSACIALLILLTLHTVATAQPKNKNTDPYDVTTDEMTGSPVFKGTITFYDLQNEPAFDWMKSGVKEYKPDVAKVAYLEKNLGKYELVVFMGTWCDDSHNLIPKLYKVLQAADYKGKLTMYGVDRDKTTKHGDEKVYNITLVPTIILERDKKEIGRITETVQESMEADLVKIVEKEK